MQTENYQQLEQEIISGVNAHGATDALLDLFRECMWSYYAESGRVLPWRETNDPHRILVSEVMLQQTQVPRVLSKYAEYNQRAVALKATAETVVGSYCGRLPSEFDALCSLPGIGLATAAAVSAFAFNKAVLFIETNVRAVYIHFFFNDQAGITDKRLFPFIERTLDKENPRDWYYAIMDYGSMLKKTRVNPSRKSAHHVRQSKYEGSHRQLRAGTLRFVLGNGAASSHAVANEFGIDTGYAAQILNELEKEGFLTNSGGAYSVR